jgi:hypothetical protein
VTEQVVPTSGTLSAKIIRACPEHAQCELDCPHRPVEELGEVATFDNRSIMARLKENYFRWRHSFPQ